MMNDELKHHGKKGMKWKHKRPRQREKYIDPRYSGGNVYRRGEGVSQSSGSKDSAEKWKNKRPRRREKYIDPRYSGGNVYRRGESNTAKKQSKRNYRELNRQNTKTAFSSFKKKKKLISRLFGSLYKKR